MYFTISSLQHLSQRDTLLVFPFSSAKVIFLTFTSSVPFPHAWQLPYFDAPSSLLLLCISTISFCFPFLLYIISILYIYLFVKYSKKRVTHDFLHTLFFPLPYIFAGVPTLYLNPSLPCKPQPWQQTQLYTCCRDMAVRVSKERQILRIFHLEQPLPIFVTFTIFPVSVLFT